MINQKFDIVGMTCSACSSKVEKSVSKLTGVEKVAVNLLTNSMYVEYNEKIIDDNDIISTVMSLGYGASLHNEVLKNNNKENNDVNTQQDIEIRKLKYRFIVSLIFLIPLMYISMHHMLYEWIGLPIPRFISETFDGMSNLITFTFSQFLLLLPIIYVNQKYFKVGFKSLIKASPNMDSLIAIGSGAATIYGIFVIFRLGYGFGHGDMSIIERYSMDIYFESAAMILTLITLGKYLEAKSKGKTGEAITKLMDLTPKTALVERKDGEVELPIEEVIINDIVIIKPGSNVTVDGIVIEGVSSIDESAITGESIPVEKTVGDKVVAATTNKSGYLKVRATKVGEDTTINQIIKLVEEASSSKAPIAKLADKISGIFVPVVISIAIASAIVWLLVGKDFEFALSIGIAVLVISCPCALGLATPVAIMVGTGKGAENGILIKSGEALEIAHSIDTVVLDKTGTITQGKPIVTDIVTYGYDKSKLLQIAASLEKSSEHPLAEAIKEYTFANNIELLNTSNFKALFGRGITAVIDDMQYFAGNIPLMQDNNIDVTVAEDDISKFSDDGKTPLLFANNNRIIGLIAVSDVIKSGSKKAIELFKNMNINVIMLTGDNKRTAEAIRRQLDITDVVAEVLPEQKEQKIRELQDNGHKVAMIGDGINDAPSLARADVGIAIGAGTDVAIESADIILVKSDLLDAVSAIRLSKAVIRNIKENLFWAFFYNSIGIPLAAGVFYSVLNWKLNPMFGAAAMSLSSVCVVTNALRLKFFKTDFNKQIKKENDYMFGKKKYDVKIIIDGMSCSHCSGRVENALNNIDGVEAKVDLKKKTAFINLKNEVSDEILKKTVEDAGYTVVSIEK